MGNIISIIRGEGSPYYGDYNDMVYPNLVGKDVEYEYDPNGNLIKNSDNRISLTTYNLLNLPQTVAFSDKSLSVFYYMADGRKIRNATGAYSISTAVPIDSVIKNTDPYISYMSEWNDEFWYQGKLQKYINTPEGNIEVSTGRKMSFSYYYTSKDHLGSIWHYWSSLNNSRANIYYPSGIMREKRRSPYNYGLTGKEIVYDNGLDEYFFGARTLFAPINRFNQPDPLCEEYYHISPYAYCANNFINVLDPDGRADYKVNSNGGIVKNHPFIETLKTLFGLKDKTDRLIAANGEILSIPGGSIGEISHIYDSKGNVKGHYFKVQDYTLSEDIHAFLSENSNVEWGHIRSLQKSNESNWITTSHSLMEETSLPYLVTNLLTQKNDILEITHSHRVGEKPSGYTPGDVDSNDKNFIKYIKKNYPYQDIQYRMYYAPYRIYIYYNLKGIYEIERRKK